MRSKARMAVACTALIWAAYPCLAVAQNAAPAPAPEPAAAPAPAAAPEPAPPPPPAPEPSAVQPSYAPPPPGEVSTSAALGSGIEDQYSRQPYYEDSKVGRISGFMGWTFNVPLGSVRDFTTNVSPLGFEIQFNGWVTPNISLGVSGEWATYVDNRPRTTYTVDNAAITATAYNYLQTTTARALIHYCFLGQAPVQPYIGPHIGVSWSFFDSEAADLVLSDTQVSVNFGGEAGVQIPFGRNAPSALVNLRYSYSPSAEFRNSVSSVQSIGMMIGIGF